MGFQVGFSSSSNARQGVIQTFSAGEDQAVICSVFNTVEATVQGDLTGHTTLWELVSGGSVTMLTDPVNNLSLYYQASDLSDRVFRFWIDKDTAGEMYSDVNVWGTPTEQADTIVTQPIDEKALNSFWGTTTGSRSAVLSIGTDFISTKSEAYLPLESTDLALFWSVIDAASPVQFVINRLNGSGGWDIVTTVSGTERSYRPISPGDVYMVEAVYDDGIPPIRRLSSEESNMIGYTVPEITTLISNSDSIAQSSIDASVTSDYQVNLLTKVTLEGDSLAGSANVGAIPSADPGAQLDTIQTLNFTVTLLTIVKLISPETDAVNNNANVPSTDPAVQIDTIQTHDYNVINLTGEQIGG